MQIKIKYAPRHALFHRSKGKWNGAARDSAGESEEYVCIWIRYVEI